MPYKDREKQRAYQREWLAKRRRTWLEVNGPCVECGSWNDLEVDHVDASDKVDHKIWSWSAKRRKTELSKCQVLCRSCHDEKTTQNGERHFAPADHGSETFYRHRGCRCDLCKAWKRKENKKRDERGWR